MIDLVPTVSLLVIVMILFVALLRALRAAERADWRALRADRAVAHWRARAIRAEQSVWGGPPPHNWSGTGADQSTQLLPVLPGHEIRSHREGDSDAT